MNETENQSVVASEASNPGVREDILHYDPLLDCLVELSRFHGRPATRAALTAGLPLEKGSLTPSLFALLAAERQARAVLSREPCPMPLARQLVTTYQSWTDTQGRAAS